MKEEGRGESSQGPGSSFPAHFLSGQHTPCEEPTPLSVRRRGVTCTVDGLRHGGREDAGQPGARPELQHRATLEEVPLGQDVVRQEQGAPPHLEGRGTRNKGGLRLPRDPSGPWEADGTYPPACQHPPGGWPWCALDGTETERERATVKTGMDRTETDGVRGRQQKHRPGYSQEGACEHHSHSDPWVSLPAARRLGSQEDLAQLNQTHIPHTALFYVQ